MSTNPSTLTQVSEQPAEPRVLIRTEHSLGRITLNRPEAINAIDLGMIQTIRSALDAWRNDTDVATVLIDSTSDRGLCSGGDVRALYDVIVAGRPEEGGEFFRAEYAMNAVIAEYPKPIVAFADGITMGGGIGLAGHAAIRIVTERSKLAMPETRIGFTPDVGGTWLLGRAPGRLGEYLGMTGTVMNGADALYAGFADYYVPSDRLDDLREALTYRADPGTPSEIVMLFDETPDASELADARSWIDEAFSADSVPAIIDRLEKSGHSDVVELLGEMGPTGLIVTLDAVREARAMRSVREALEGEYRRVMWFVENHPDIVEGIRAQLVDKDRQPKWQPPGDRVGARTFVPRVPLWSSGR